MKFALFTITLSLLALPLFAQEQPLYKDANAGIDDRVEDLLSRMTPYEKIGQMTQLNITLINTTGNQSDVELVEEKAAELIRDHHIGSFLNGEAVPPQVWFEFMDGLTRLAVEESRLNIPIIYGMDHIHGASYLGESTIFPQNINLGATFNPVHTYNTAWVTAYETADIGHHWNFAPVLDIGVNPYWPRLWETFGEDPYLASVLAATYVDGFQNNEEVAPYRQAATAKHFIGYSDPKSGWDRTPVHIGMQALHEIHRPPFQAAIDAGVKAVMANSGEVNGVPVHASYEFLTELLREEMGFEGVVVTDWDDIEKLVSYHFVAENYKEATYMAVMAGIDINMTPLSLQFNEALMELYEEGRITDERLDLSVRRILRLKFELGLFEHPYPRSDRLDRVGTEENRLKALEAAKESMILLKNDHVLPAENPSNILLFGPSANSRRNLNGGWTLAWQGGEEEQYPESMHTVLTALRAEYPNAQIDFIETIPEQPNRGFINRLNRADLLIYAGGEEPYTEFVGNITDLALPGNQLHEIETLSTADTPLVLVLIQGRPRLITTVIESVDAFLFAGLPGFEGGEAIASVLSGRTNPSGRLPISYPQHRGHFVTYNHKPSDVYFFNPEEANHIAQGSDNTSLFQFGEGLSYTTFDYSPIELSADELDEDGRITATVTVTNSGDRAGQEAVLWYLTNEYASITRPVKELRHFEKVHLEPGQSHTFEFVIEPHAHLSFPDRNGEMLLETGPFTLQVGGQQTRFRLTD
ncbi:MAG: glycoside hydrolase family 3 N-terminal domain-containing protein [Balneolaceae bacterium]